MRLHEQQHSHCCRESRQTSANIYMCQTRQGNKTTKDKIPTQELTLLQYKWNLLLPVSAAYEAYAGGSVHLQECLLRVLVAQWWQQTW